MTPVARALHEAASAIRALSDGELLALALKASEAGALPPTIGRGEEHAPPASNRRASSRRAEAPKSPALSSEAGEPASARPRLALAARVEQALEVLAKGPRRRDEISKALGISRTGQTVNELFARLRNHPRVKEPSARGGTWSLR